MSVLLFSWSAGGGTRPAEGVRQSPDASAEAAPTKMPGAVGQARAACSADNGGRKAAGRDGTIVGPIGLPVEQAMNEAHKPLRKNNKFFRKIRCYIFHKKESFSNFASEKMRCARRAAAARTEEV
ncbi:hypothetical protein [uncultured Alistipes sp.]|uniref:hypothetical protein n=1 Tax=uncultured Alistipes sp. TaxID=538949 RepID=UPI00272D1496|nr:hypothetical protein [uncultured Alistipes sp.]